MTQGRGVSNHLDCAPYDVGEVARSGRQVSPDGRSLYRLQAQNWSRLAIFVVGDEVDQPIRSLSHVANPAQLLRQRFFVDDALTAQREPGELLAHHAADEQIATPPGEAITRVNHQARDADRRHPHVDRLLHALAVRTRVNGQTGSVVDAKPDDRPPIVAARLQPIQLIASLRAVLVRPYLAGLRMNGEALYVPMAVAPDLRSSIGAVDERVVCRHAAIVMQPNHLAMVV